MKPIDALFSWQAKSGPPPHPVLCHLMDVGAVATELLNHRPLDVDPSVNDAFALLIALHDLGKVSAAFQNMLNHGIAQADEARHWRITGSYFSLFRGQLESLLDADYFDIRPLLSAVVCHHGDFKCPAPKVCGAPKYIGEAALSDAPLILSRIAELFPNASLAALISDDARVEEDRINQLAWKLSGLTVQADWIGSNTTWFTPTPDCGSVDEYWAYAQTQANRALRAAGLFTSQPKRKGATRIIGPTFTPRPMQAAALSISVVETPSLFVLEDTTGSGKTEAGLILAARLLAAGHGRGLFFALPTMATSNAMFERVNEVMPHIFEGSATLGLSHSKAHLSESFQNLLAAPSDAPVACTDWLADGRRQILFADMAVGTIDQALLSILPTRFNTFRQWALSDKVLIVDEAHSYDPFMAAELETLLRFHRYHGGSAILMTATLPSLMKQSFIAAYGQTQNSDLAYPQLTSVTTDVSSRAVDTVEENKRRIEVLQLSDQAQVLDYIAHHAKAGAAIAWVRNAVDDAIEAVCALNKMGLDVDLLHARFAMADRLSKENELIANLGKGSGKRAGRIVIATQVMEQSLDLDFDVMISDLAPIGSMIQRAGRLWRHREREARAVQTPVLAVLSPDPTLVQDDKWLSRVLDRGAWVYDLATQWRSAQVLFEAGEIVEPDGLRHLIETVHSDTLSVPDAIVNAEQKRIGEAKAERGMALAQTLVPEKGFDQYETLNDDDVYATRLGEDQRTLCLATVTDNGLEPFCDSWEMSEVSASRKRLAPFGLCDEDPEHQAVKSKWPKFRRRMVTLVVVSDDGRIANGLSYSRRIGLVFGDIDLEGK